MTGLLSPFRPVKCIIRGVWLFHVLFFFTSGSHSNHPTRQLIKTCKQCLQHFDVHRNSADSCQYHAYAETNEPALFLRRPHPMHHYVYEVDESFKMELDKRNWEVRVWVVHKCSQIPGFRVCRQRMLLEAY